MSAGVWAAGEKWHYAPLAACLARLGVMACVVQYTLFPDALVPQLVEEVAAAFDWVAANGARYGGNVSQLSLVGHSAGAQLCMMALLQRAQAAHGASSSSSSSNGQTSDPQPQQQLVMPAQFVAVTGVYDIAKHYSYEKQRGVHELSTMKRAMGGFQNFAAMSPAVILGAALQRHRLQQQQQWVQATPDNAKQQQQQQQEEQEPAACSFYSSFQLSGEAVAHRIGFDRGSDHNLAAEAGLQLQSESGMTDQMPFDVAAAALLPPTVLLSSCTDITVPWFESAEIYWRLLDCGVPVKHLVYNKVGHGDFVVDWPSRFGLGVAAADDWGAQPPAAATTGAGPAAAEAADDWACGSDAAGGSSSSNGVAVMAGASGTAGAVVGAGSSSSSRRSRERQLLLEELPPYCRDIAVLVMREQLVSFTQQQPRSVAPAAAGGRLVPGRDVVAVDAQVLVTPAELN